MKAKVTFERKLEKLFDEACKDRHKRKQLVNLIMDADMLEVSDAYLEMFVDNGVVRKIP